MPRGQCIFQKKKRGGGGGGGGGLLLIKNQLKNPVAMGDNGHLQIDYRLISLVSMYNSARA